ncbi:hypothetical protein C1I63_07625 [Rathayibacter caricis DSM 15933]|uniref:DUF4190 domain-containing protein n=1 Tax=Rathayibacter caricis DSM 15933 TaxID=1328867 RepID=A0A2T4UT86_9MICO|nr:hypothetical protein [Rathayibacter caricis]PTL72727.1 hypothetical protein C1I63_07625 [Rathayibacter caricis DSM 15933]
MTTAHSADPVGPTYAPLSILAGASFWIGIGSILLGWTILAPFAGVVLGILSLRREPIARRTAAIGIALNSLCLLVYLGALTLILLTVVERLALQNIGGPLS